MIGEFLGFSRPKLKVSVILGFGTVSLDNRCPDFKDCFVTLCPWNVVHWTFLPMKHRPSRSLETSTAVTP
jgi:hypothetical protein